LLEKRKESMGKGPLHERLQKGGEVEKKKKEGKRETNPLVPRGAENGWAGEREGLNLIGKTIES